MADPAHGHNSSAQQHVSANPDLALHTSREHTHEHIHHGHAAAEAIDKQHHDAAYTVGTTFDRSTVPDQYSMHQRRGVPREKGEDVNVLDAEKGSLGSPAPEPEAEKPGFISRMYRRYRIYVHLVIFLFFTGWWIASLVLHVHNRNWIIPFLLWLCITIRLITFHVPVSYATRPVFWLWTQTISRAVSYIPEKFRIPLGAAGAIAVILVGAFVSEESADNTRANRAVSLFGLVVMLFILWCTSRNRKAIQWQTVTVGMLTQFIVALFVLRTKAGFDIFNFVAFLATKLLSFARAGVAFLTTPTISQNTYFFFSALPSIVFFVSFVGVLFYWGILQWCVKKVATFFFWSMKVSGAEAVVAAASPFIGQGESAMLIKPFVAHLTMAELHQVMCSGFATIAGSVLVAYISYGVNGTALISSCVMSIPASLAVSKMRYPETEETLTSGRVVIPDDDEHRAVNTLHAFANSAWLGLKIAGMILTNLLCIIAAVALINALLGWWGGYININSPPLTLELILGYICYPIAFLLGVPRRSDELLKVGQLIGIKVIQNEFVAYSALTNATGPYADLSDRSKLIATYALCGFGNIGSLGTQIGVLSQISPSRSGDVSKVAFSALLTGIISTLSSASIAGLLVTDERTFFQPASAKRDLAAVEAEMMFDSPVQAARSLAESEDEF